MAGGGGLQERVQRSGPAELFSGSARFPSHGFGIPGRPGRLRAVVFVSNSRVTSGCWQIAAGNRAFAVYRFQELSRFSHRDRRGSTAGSDPSALRFAHPLRRKMGKFRRLGVPRAPASPASAGRGTRRQSSLFLWHVSVSNGPGILPENDRSLVRCDLRVTAIHRFRLTFPAHSRTFSHRKGKEGSVHELRPQDSGVA